MGEANIESVTKPTRPPTAPVVDFERDRSLEGLRAPAAGLVLVFHLVGAVAIIRPERVPTAMRFWTAQFGSLGVSIFFVLSGFLLSRPFVTAQVLGRRTSPPLTYLSRRFARIFPAYWLAGGTYLLFVTKEPRPGVGRAAEYLLLAQNYRYGDVLLGLGVAWTLVIELSFYLALPLLAALVGRQHPVGAQALRRWVVLASALYVAGIASRLVGNSVTRPPTGSWQVWRFPQLWLPGYLDWFALGIGLAVLATRELRSNDRPSRLAGAVVRHPNFTWLAAVGLYGMSHLARYPTRAGQAYTDVQLMVRNTSMPIVAALIVAPIALATAKTGAIRRALASKVVFYLGTISYGIYLWQIISIRIVRTQIEEGRIPKSPAILVALATTLTLVFATASWYALERPIIRAVRRLRL